MVYVFAADGFEEIELVAPVDMLRRAGAQVCLLGVGSLTVTGSHGIKITADAPAQSADLSDAQMIVLPGGSRGVANLAASVAVSGAIEQAAARGIFIGAICAAPSLLQKAGLLDGRKFTCYPGCENPRLGGSFTGEPVEISDNIVTSRGAGTALLFGRALTEVLMGAAAAQKVYCDIKAV